MSELEPKIRPLVEVLNETGLVQTFSSCEGHYSPEEQTLVDRNHAEVRFVPADGSTVARVEKWLARVLIRFKVKYGLIPVKVTAYKLYTPVDEDAVDETFVVELKPFNRFDPPDRKRADTDRAITQLIQILVS